MLSKAAPRRSSQGDDMKWMDAAWSELGEAEIKGPDANPNILAFFHDVGLKSITSDETPSCGAFVGACLIRSGIALDAIPVGDRALARSYLNVGTAIPGPRVGAVCVLPRGKDWQGHTGFVTAFTEDRVKLLGSNQGDKVSDAWFKREGELGYRWPEAVSAGQIKSRIISAADSQKGDLLKVGAAAAATPAMPSTTPTFGLDNALDNASTVQKTAQMIEQFVGFAMSKWPWVVAALAAYFGGRMFYNAVLIKHLRVEDHNTGKNTGTVT